MQRETNITFSLIFYGCLLVIKRNAHRLRMICIKLKRKSNSKLTWKDVGCWFRNINYFVSALFVFDFNIMRKLPKIYIQFGQRRRSTSVTSL